jgi:arylsulfatase A-like enzyme
MKPTRVLLLLLGALLAAVTAAWQTIGPTAGRLPAARTPRHRPDIVLVTIDAMRADHLSPYGYQPFTSPAIDAFSRHAARFTNAIAQAPYTKASVASIMTGQYPSAHKTVTASVPFPETMTGHPTTVPISTDVLPSSATTLAQGLRDVGYRTVGFTANPFLIESFGFAQGFDRFRFYPGSDFASSDRLVSDAIDAARDSDRRRPLFVWVHLMEPHSPYTPRPLTAGMFQVSGPPQPIPLEVSIPGWLLPGSPRDRRQYLAAYDDDIAAVDAAFGTLIREVRAMRAWRDTIVVMTADHGEQFLDHGGWEHGSNLYDELIRVPLVIQTPGADGVVIDAQAQLIDLFPTLLESAEAAIPATAGRSLAGLMKRTGPSRPAMSEIVGSQYAVRDEGFKLIATTSGAEQLFDLTADPHEVHDIAAATPARVEHLRSMLDRMRADAVEAGRHIRRQTVPVDPAAADRLRALGYVQP